MKRDALVELILSYPPDTEFFVKGQGLQEGFPVKNIRMTEFKYNYDLAMLQEDDLESFLWSKYNAKFTDVIIEACTK